MKHILSILLFFFTAPLFAQVNLPSFFSDNMVLQRNAEVNFWGWGNRGGQVTIIPSWSKDTIKVKVTGYGRFDTKLRTPEAGGPYDITVITGRYKKVLKNVLIGEVWLCSGQSNMQWSSNNKLQEMLDELPKANNPRIRLLQISNIATKFPQDNIFDSWTECNSETANGFSAIGYFIAKQLNTELNVPIGIINSSWGGTPAEFWTPANYIEADQELLTNAKVHKPNAGKPYEYATIWNAMINPFAGYTMAGAFWYQGETNVGTYSGYNKLFSTMIKSWREAWKSDFPFFYVQIAPYDYKSPVNEQKGALLREQQVKALDVPKTAMAVITDLVPDVTNIHPTRKKEVAQRLANIALTEVYHKNAVDYKSPVYKSYKIDGNKIIIDFHYLQGKLQVKGKEITDLFIADDSKNFVPASYKIDKNKLVVFNKDVKKPAAVRFGFTDTAMSNLFNEKGLPVSPFRTDKW
ncbi:Sialate O-acetylesterase [Pseudopedobacter saltans DSM 12145]|uniref:Sialate O-acetylesterase n=1 Tax=Pseudopedobacter saltans (strain ATCC 51119 / DSM 12145 / JCM 21818 / CCUG 39354 / LMG 10337 / NBRC 100064 / NCIMB 13643) TaxID=762903 RepID=F0SE55_PSESL|nr:sialate O-acetylesterase [Pseudopedobacter saltans]ADY52981.1 Sialate O-acetylesterase [Pseudopedobacter saltans DSM 12145]